VPAGRALAALALAALAALAGSGCAARAAAAPAIQLATAYVPVPQEPGTTVGYVVIHNGGPPDRLVAARTSRGGRVSFQMDAPHGAPRTVRWVPVPGHGTLAMSPGGTYLVITGARGLRGGEAITLTLVFARAGPVSVVAQVTNPATGGSSYFVN
jgi:copper(I)-binding protein